MPQNQMLLDWLSGPVLSELLVSQDIAPGLPKSMPDALYEPSDTVVVGWNVIWDAIQGIRTVAPLSDPLSPSRRIEQQPRLRRQAVAVASRTNFSLEQELLIYMQSNIDYLRNKAAAVMKQKAMDFRQSTDNLVISLPHSAFALDAIYADRSGNLLPSSTNAEINVQFSGLYAGANALNKNSYWPNLTQVTANQVGDWSNTSTDIPSSLRAARQSFTFTSNYQAAHVLYGKAVPGYFYNNTAMQTYMSRQPTINMQFMDTNEVPAGLLDYQWHPVYDAYYVDQYGNIQKWFADNEIIIIPEPSPMWYEYFECSLNTPQGIVTPTGTIEDFLASCPVVKGYSSYCHGKMDPPSLDCIQQWGGLPVIKNPYVKWQVTVS